jgi:hypothetical protein
MYLLYADESGAIGDPTERFFVLAGLAVFEREPHWLERNLEEIAKRFDKDEPQLVELHGSPMRAGKGKWRHFPKRDREQAIVDALSTGVCKRHPGQMRLFAAVLEKKNFAGQDIAGVAFEQLSSRFDQFFRSLASERQHATWLDSFRQKLNGETDSDPCERVQNGRTFFWEDAELC